MSHVLAIRVSMHGCPAAYMCFKPLGLCAHGPLCMSPLSAMNTPLCIYTRATMSFASIYTVLVFELRFCNCSIESHFLTIASRSNDMHFLAYVIFASTPFSIDCGGHADRCIKSAKFGRDSSGWTNTVWYFHMNVAFLTPFDFSRAVAARLPLIRLESIGDEGVNFLGIIHPHDRVALSSFNAFASVMCRVYGRVTRDDAITGATVSKAEKLFGTLYV